MRTGRRSGARRIDARPGVRPGAPVAAPRDQRHGHRRAHEPRAQPACRRGRERRERRGARLLHAGVRHRCHGARQPPRPCGAPHLYAHRRRGGAGREQQRGGGHDGAPRVRARARSRGVARRAGGDRRIVPRARHHGAVAGAHGGGGHHEQDACRRLRARHRRRHLDAVEGASFELPRGGLRRERVGARPAPAGRCRERTAHGIRRAGRGRASGVRGPGIGRLPEPRCVRRVRRAHRGRVAAGGLRPRVVLGRQAAGRPAGGHHRGSETVHRPAEEEPLRPRDAPRQDDAGRAGGHAAPLPRPRDRARAHPCAAHAVRAGRSRARARRAAGAHLGGSASRRGGAHRRGTGYRAGRRRRAAVVRHRLACGAHRVFARGRAGVRDVPHCAARRARDRAHQARRRAAGRAHRGRGRASRGRRGRARLLRRARRP